MTCVDDLSKEHSLSLINRGREPYVFSESDDSICIVRKINNALRVGFKVGEERSGIKGV